MQVFAFVVERAIKIGGLKCSFLGPFSAYRGENPDIINHQSIMREYGTLGRMPKDQPPPYQDFLGGGEQILIR